MPGALTPMAIGRRSVPGCEGLGKLILAIGFCLFGCQRTEDKRAGTTSPVRASSRPQHAATLAVRPGCPDKLDDAFFFPVGSLGERKAPFDEDASRRSWYSDE